MTTTIARAASRIALQSDGSARILLTPERAEALALAIRGAQGPARVIWSVQRTAALLVATVKPEEGGLWTISVRQEGRYGWQACGWECVSWSELRRVSRALIGLADEIRERVEAAE